MSDHGARCAALGISNQEWQGYARQALTYLDQSFYQPRVIKPAELRAAAIALEDKPEGICEMPQSRAQAASVLGYVLQAESIDKSIDQGQLYKQILKDHARFQALVPLANGGGFGNSIQRFAPDVANVVSPYYCDRLFDDPPTREQGAALQAVIENVRTTAARGETPVVVFDLDDTLFGGGPRSHRMLREYLDWFVKEYPDELSDREIATIRSIKPEELGFRTDYNLRMKWGIANEKFLGHWFMKGFLPKFFTSEYCQLDSIYPGAVDYVRAIYNAEATVVIVYFTGRQEGGATPGTEKGMRPGTIKALGKATFPVPDGKRVHLIMKPMFEENILNAS